MLLYLIRHAEAVEPGSPGAARDFDRTVRDDAEDLLALSRAEDVWAAVVAAEAATIGSAAAVLAQVRARSATVQRKTLWRTITRLLPR